MGKGCFELNAPPQDKNYIREIAFILFSQKKIAMVGALLVLVATIAIAYLAPPKYEAVATFLLKSKKIATDPGALEKTQLRPMPITKADIYSEIEIITSEKVILKTAEMLLPNGLDRMLWLPANTSEKMLLSTFRRKMESRLKMTVLPGSNVIEARLQWTDHRAAKKILNILIENYLAYRQRIFNPQGKGKFFADQVENYQKSLAEKNVKLLAITKNLNTPDIQLEIEQNFKLGATLMEQLRSLEVEENSIKTYIRQIKSQLALKKISYFGFIENDTVRQLGSQLQKLIIKRQQGKQQAKAFLPPRGGREGDAASTLNDLARSADYKEKAAQLIAMRSRFLNEQIEQLNKNLRSEVRAILNANRTKHATISKRIEKFKRQISGLKSKNIELKQAEIQVNRLKREIDLLAQSYNTFYLRREETRTNQAEGNVELLAHVVVLQNASAERKPVFPNKMKLFPLGIVAALLTAVSLGFLAHFFDHTIKRPEDIEEELGVPVLFSINDQGSNWGWTWVRGGSAGAKMRWLVSSFNWRAFIWRTSLVSVAAGALTVIVFVAVNKPDFIDEVRRFISLRGFAEVSPETTPDIPSASMAKPQPVSGAVAANISDEGLAVPADTSKAPLAMPPKAPGITAPSP